MAAKPKPKKTVDETVATELDAIKRLLILQLIVSGVRAADIADALGVHSSVISRLVPARKVKTYLGR